MTLYFKTCLKTCLLMLAAAVLVGPCASAHADVAGDAAEVAGEALEDAAENTEDMMDKAAESAADDKADMAMAAEESADDGFDNDIDRISYAIGIDIGSSFKAQPFDINPDIMSEALAASYAGDELRMDSEQALAVIQNFQQELQMKQMEAAMKEQEQAAAANTEAAAAFFAENKTKEGVQQTDSGLQYIIEEKGDGPLPGPNDFVTVHYKGQLLDGEVFDSSYDRGEPATFPIDGVIPGFGEGLQLMPVGSKGTLFIPGELAYGPQGGPGGANATLIFDVEIIATEAPEATEPEPSELPALGD